MYYANEIHLTRYLIRTKTMKFLSGLFDFVHFSNSLA